MSGQFMQQDQRLWETVSGSSSVERARYLAAVERGVCAAESNDFASDERIAKMFARWGMELDAQA